jgi:peptidyl-prolyl cis-trans isomerase D
MAVIGTIRNKLGPFIVIIIGLALAVFVLEMAINSNTNLLGSTKDVVAEIGGEKIKIQQYQKLIDEMTANYIMQSGQRNIDQNLTYALREQAWTQMINDYINQTEYAMLGLSVSTEELRDMFYGAEPIAEIKQAFTNPSTGIFDPRAVENFVQNLDQDAEGQAPGTRRAQWVNFEKAQIELRFQEKYKNLVKKAVYIPAWMAQVDYNEKNARASLQYVMVPYTSIADTSVSFTDEELQSYIDRNQEKFKQEESRKIAYASAAIVPSSGDSAISKKWIDEMYASLLAAPGDTNLLKLNSDRGLDQYYYSQTAINSPVAADTLFKLPVGTLYGPYFENSSYRIAKILDRREVPDSVSARHILLRIENEADSNVVKQKADSIFNALNQGTPFDSLAIRFSQDQSTAPTGGKLGYLGQGQTVKNFNQFLFFSNATAGSRKVVKTEFGYHIVEVELVKNMQPAMQVVFISRPVEPSNETDKILFEKISRFASGDLNLENFEENAVEQGLVFQEAPFVRKADYQLPGLPIAREIVQWSFHAKKKGEASAVFSLNTHYVVAIVKELKEEGTSPLADVRAQVEMAVRKEKKGNQIAQQLSGMLSLNTTLESLSQKVNQSVGRAGNVTFGNAYAENIGYEPKVVGTGFGLSLNQFSKPVIGEQGVYVLQLVSLEPAQPIADLTTAKNQLTGMIAPRMEYGITEAVKKTLKIEDNRYLFF